MLGVGNCENVGADLDYSYRVSLRKQLTEVFLPIAIFIDSLAHSLASHVKDTSELMLNTVTR